MIVLCGIEYFLEVKIRILEGGVGDVDVETVGDDFLDPITLFIFSLF